MCQMHYYLLLQQWPLLPFILQKCALAVNSLKWGNDCFFFSCSELLLVMVLRFKVLRKRSKECVVNFHLDANKFQRKTHFSIGNIRLDSKLNILVFNGTIRFFTHHLAEPSCMNVDKKKIYFQIFFFLSWFELAIPWLQPRTSIWCRN